MADILKNYKLDRSTLDTVSLFDDAATIKKDRAYWMAQPPEARWNATELMRQINYGTAATCGRLQRILEITELKRR